MQDLQVTTARRHLPSSKVPSRTEQRRQFSFDPPLHAAMARLTRGVSPAALMQAHADWARQLLFSPDKRIELVEKAGWQWAHYLEYCSRAYADPACDLCIEPLPQDKRFSSEAWHRWPFNTAHQGFLLTQQWWHKATTGIYGVSKHHEDVISFVARQMLDMVSPANFPITESRNH